MQTALTRVFNVRVPLILAPCAGVSGGRLAAAVHRGGGLGFIAAARAFLSTASARLILYGLQGHVPISQLEAELATGRQELGLKAGDPLPLGVGIILWKFEAPHGQPNLARPLLAAILDARPRAIWLSFGDRDGLEGWIDRIRSMEDDLSRTATERASLFVMVPNAARAVEAARLGADVVVAQGVEAGGHGPDYHSGLPLLSLLPAIQAAFRGLSNPPILVGAGGISNGAQLAAVLPWAEGAVAGTAFLATPESLYNEAQKKLILDADGSKTLRTMNFDLARNTLGWGEGVDGRGIANTTSQEDADVVGSEAGVALYDKAVKSGDVNRIVTWAGSSVGEVTSGQGAAEVCQTMERQALEALDRLQRLWGRG